MNEILIIGVGNGYRGDDGAGLVVARRLREMVSPRVIVLEQSGEGTALMEAWREASQVIIVDAAASGAAPGTIHRFEADSQPLPSKFFNYSSHAFSVAEAVEMARKLDQLPPDLVVYGIEGQSFSFGEGLSAKVDAAAEIVVQRVLQELGSGGRG